MSCRRFAAEYVSAHLHGLAVIADISGAAAAAANSPSPALAAGNVIATHNGSFHCDEALACGLLRHTDLYRHAIVLRTRDPAQIDQCAIVVDVGAVYDPSRNRYDHHQSSFQETMTTDSRTYKTRLSSAGLVYKHFGKEIIESFLRQALADATVRALSRLPTEQEGYSPNDINAVFDVVYKHFVEQVDGIDNGVDQFSLPDGGEGFDGKALVRNYIQSTTLSHRVGSIQAWWNEADRCNNTVIENALFAEAVEMASREFFEAVTYFAFSWLPARAIVEDALDHAKEVHPSGRILVLKEFCPWKEHLLEIEVERGCAGHALYVVFADGKGGSWRVQAVPKESVGFASRRPLPFAGLRDDALSAASGIDGGVFVHVSGFIGGMKTYEGALALAAKALEAE